MSNFDSNIKGNFYPSRDVKLHRSESVKNPPRKDGEPIIKLDQVYINEVTAIIWPSATKYGPLSTMQHPGHASLQLRKSMETNAYKLAPETYNSNQLKPLYRYISFVPGNVDTKRGAPRSGRFNPSYLFDCAYETGDETTQKLADRTHINERKNQFVIETNHPDDIFPDEIDLLKNQGKKIFGEIWGTKADVIISLRAFGNDENTLGLHMNNILNWCIKIWQNNSAYSFISKTNNCASIAWRALDKGGGNAFYEYHTGALPDATFYFTPNDFKKYCEFVDAGIIHANMDLDGLVRTAERKNKIDNYSLKGLTGSKIMPGQIYTAKEFKADSDTGWRLRGRLLWDIDAALEKYHGLGKWDFDNYSGKLSCLLKIIKLLSRDFDYSNRNKDPRDGALYFLIFQIKLQLEALRLEDLVAFNPTDFTYQSTTPPKK